MSAEDEKAFKTHLKQTSAILKEHWTRKGGRYVVSHPKGKDTFEFDDSSEQRDQLMNAYHFCQDLKDKGEVHKILDYVQKKDGLDYRRVQDVFIKGRFNEEGVSHD